MKVYLDLLRHVMEHGRDRTDRTGVGTRAVFGYQLRHDMAEGFPLLTTKKVHFKSVIVELLWFLRGDTNVKFLRERGVTIWDEWAQPDGSLGPVYGKQWRDFGGVDQIAGLLDGIRKSPDSRRLIVSAWNPPDVPKMALPPCHTLWQCRVDEGRLDLHLYARSIDSFLGLPFNIASYGLLLTILSHICGLEPGELIISFGDLHIYKNHFEQVATQLQREPRPLPKLSILKPVTVDGGMVWTDFAMDMEWTDFALEGYEPAPAIKAPIAV